MQTGVNIHRRAVNINQYDSLHKKVRIRKSAISWLISLIIVLGPILQHYKGRIWDLGSDLYIFLFPVVLFLLIRKGRITVRYSLPMIFLGLWIGLSHGFTLNVFGREILLIVLYVAIDSDVIDTTSLAGIAISIAEIASILIIVQYICYYILGFHLQLVPTSLLKDSAEQWVMLAKTGRISVTGSTMSFYRPSAFFLEPSHIATFSFPLLIYLLTSRRTTKQDIRKAINITVGVLLSTSGIGIVFCIGVWCIYFLLYSASARNSTKSLAKRLFTARNLIILIAILLILILAFYTVPLFRKSVTRIFVPEQNGNNAMQARNASGSRLIRWLSGKEAFLGVGLANKGDVAEWNIAGFYYMFYIYGLVGVVLSLYFYVRTIGRKVAVSSWIALFVIVLSFFSVHTYAVFYRFYLTAFVMIGYKMNLSVGQGDDQIMDLSKRGF